MTQSNDKELLPCPFCGGTKINRKSRKGVRGTIHKTKWWRGRYKCEKCGCQSSQKTNPESAVISWNTRAQPTPPQKTDAELVGLVAKELWETADSEGYFILAGKRGIKTYHAKQLAKAALQALKPYMGSGWMPIESAPKDGTEIAIKYGDSDGESTAFWSERPVCMLGDRCGGFKEGWATGRNSGTDYNLPIDTPTHWQPLPQPPESEAL